MRASGKYEILEHDFMFIFYGIKFFNFSVYQFERESVGLPESGKSLPERGTNLYIEACICNYGYPPFARFSTQKLFRKNMDSGREDGCTAVNVTISQVSPLPLL